MRSLTTAALVNVALLCLTGTAVAIADPSVPGATVETYAVVYMPAWISFDQQTGTLFAGTEEVQAKIRRIGAGGQPIEEYGAIPIQDPDAVLFDQAGLMTGMPGSVLVGGRNAGTPQIWAILPDSSQTVVGLFGPTSQWTNISDMEFDRSGRLLFGDEDGQNGRVLESTAPDSFPAQLFSVTGRIAGLEVDQGNRIFTSTFDGRIRIHAPDGSVISDPFVSGLGNLAVPIAIGPGGEWGTDLYTANHQTGELVRVDMFADTTVVGTGFDGFPIDLEFGPDGALYISDLILSRIWRVARSTTAVGQGADVRAASPVLRLSSPNPCNSSATIQYQLTASGHALLRIYDIRGQLVRTLVSDQMGPGLHSVEWDGRSASGRAVVSGVYFCRLEAEGQTLSNKLTVLR